MEGSFKERGDASYSSHNRLFNTQRCLPLSSDIISTRDVGNSDIIYTQKHISSSMLNTENIYRRLPDPNNCGQEYPPEYPNFTLGENFSQVVRTRRRKTCISDEQRVCIVCGESASGYNFDRLTCESCKAFFRRNALKPKDKIKACSRGGGCDVDGSQRKHCPSCRLEKCIAVGMKRELILPPEKLEQRAKPRRRKYVSSRGDDDSSGLTNSPHQSHTDPSSTGSGGTASHPPFIPSPPPNTMGSQLSNSQNQLSSFVHQQFPTGQPFTSSQQSSNPPFILLNPPVLPNAPNYHISSGLTDEVFPFAHPPLPVLNDSHDLPRSPTQPGAVPPLKRSQSTLSAQASSSGFNTDVDIRPLPLDMAVPSSDTTIKHQSINSSSDERTFFRCRHTQGTTHCRHRRCKHWMLRHQRRHKNGIVKHDVGNQRQLSVDPNENDAQIHKGISIVLESPDPLILLNLRECVQRFRDPFTPDEQLETGVAVTLEQEYNRMDACIRRIIRVVKMLPEFGNVGKIAQICLLRVNMYGLIVLFSSFFFERQIRKLCYPLLQTDGRLTTVTVPMLEEVPITDSPAGPSGSTTPNRRPSSDTFILNPFYRIDPKYASNVREEFELYRANTLSAFDRLDVLVGSDDVLRATVFAIKLFTGDSLDEELRPAVSAARETYLLFLWSYLRSKLGKRRLSSATELYARLLMAFIDLRTLEIRMTEFAKLLSPDGLSPLMREVCAQPTV